jgi:sodium transport system ATP-binding protein
VQQSIAIEVQHLKKQYPGVLAVNDISFQVRYGEILGLLGPNGAGKTTTLSILAGMMKSSSGKVEICQQDLAQRETHFKQKIGFLSNDTQLYERLTVMENLHFFGALQSMPKAHLKQRSEELVSHLEMTNFAHQKVGTLSAGQKQRANIARAIVHDPEVLIFDEVTASLDILSSQFIIGMIREAKTQGKAIIFSTHIMSEAEYLCDRIALIYKGKIIREGTKAELIETQNSDNLTEAFLKEIEFFQEGGQHE